MVLGSFVTAGGVVALSVLVAAMVDEGIVAGRVGSAVLLVVLTVVFLPLLRVSTGSGRAPRAALPSAAIAATG